MPVNIYYRKVAADLGAIRAFCERVREEIVTI